MMTGIGKSGLVPIKHCWHHLKNESWHETSKRIPILCFDHAGSDCQGFRR